MTMLDAWVQFAPAHFHYKFPEGEFRLVIRADNVAELYGFEVYPRFRHAGLAKRMLAMAETRARNEGAKAIELVVKWSNEPALGLYGTSGYHVYKVHDVGEELFMRKKLGKSVVFDDGGCKIEPHEL